MKIKTLHIEFTTACNSKCIMCDYWKINDKQIIDGNLVLSVIAEQVPLGLKKIYFTGGECLVFAEKLFSLVKKIRDSFPSVEIGLITNGILLNRYSQKISELFEKVIISLDTVDSEKYKRIRGIDGVDVIRIGISKIKINNPSMIINLRVLVLNDTLLGIPQLIDFALENKVNRISFIPEDTGTNTAFGRNTDSIINNHKSDISLSTLRSIIDYVKITYSSKIGTLLRHNLDDLERIYSIYSGKNVVLPICNKPTVSCVIGVNGLVSPCFFITGDQHITDEQTLSDVLSSKKYCKIVHDISDGLSSVCCNCVCPKELS